MTLIRIIIMALATAAALMAASCSKPTDFTVEGRVEGVPEQDITMSWFDGRGIRTADVRAIEGSFRIKGQSPAATAVWISDATMGRVLAIAIAENGDNIHVAVDPAKPLAGSEAGGNAATKALSEFLAANADAILNRRPEEVNRAVAEFVGAHPDSPAATALLTNIFITPGHEVEADSLLRLIAPEARSRQLLNSFPAMLASQLSADANGTIGPRTLPGLEGKTIRFFPRDASLSIIVFADDQSGRMSDSIRRLLTELTDAYPSRRLQALEISTAADSMSWAGHMRRDTTARWSRSWSPLAQGERIWRNYAIPRTPFFIVVDSTGAQRLRTSSVRDARSFITSTLGSRTNG